MQKVRLLKDKKSLSTKCRQVLATLVLISVAFLYNSIEWYNCCFVLSFFYSNTNLSRAMFVAILHRIDGEKEEGECKFEDVPSGAYYEKAVAWASTNGIVAGISATEFNPNADITREQMAAIMCQSSRLCLMLSITLRKLPSLRDLSPESLQALWIWTIKRRACMLRIWCLLQLVLLWERRLLF